MKIKHLAYDYDKKGEHLVYILEGGSYEPYVVLTKNYNGRALLMRNYLMEEDRTFNLYEGNAFRKRKSTSRLRRVFGPDPFWRRKN